MTKQTALFWTARLIVAGIFLQTLFFKFTGAKEAVWIFSTLGVEPWGRLATGGIELVAAALLLWPKTVGLGALLAVGTMAGAVLSHLTVLGVVVEGDGGMLFTMGVISLLLSAFLVFHERQWLLDGLRRWQTKLF
jgi:uncharacterized membrane protein YphA (DoxX/SURF4 family)